MGDGEKAIFTMPGQYTYHGIAYPKKAFPPEHLDLARNVNTRDGDVIVMSYPRTGTTLSIQIVSLLLSNDDQEFDAVANTVVYSRVNFLEMQHLSGNEIEKFEKSVSPRIIKTHLPPFLTSKWLENTCCVAVIRNPKDTLVSLFHFLQGIPEFGPFSGTWDEFFAVYQNGTLYNGDCIDFSLQVWNERHRKNVHVMFYEDMVTNLLPEVKKIAVFLGLERSKEQLEKVSKHADFSSMKRSKTTNYENESFAPGFQFVRNGKIGKWRKFFTEEQNEWMDERIRSKTVGTGLSFQFE